MTYGIVGVIALALELAVLHAALAAGLHQTIAVTCGYFVSAVFQFSALRYVVFKAAHKVIAFQALAFVAGQLVMWGALVAAVALLTRFLPVNTMEARLICVPSLFPLNYVISKYLIFRK